MEDPVFMAEVLKEVILKSSNLLFLSKKNGDLSPECHLGLGLFHHDCRYLGRYELRVGGVIPYPLMSSASRDFMATHELTNPPAHRSDGTFLPEQSVGITVERTVDGESLRLYDRIRLRNMDIEQPQAIEVRLTLHFQAGFEDVFELRGQKQQQRGKLHAPAWDGNLLWFRYDGADGIRRQLSVRFSLPPTVDAQAEDDTVAHFQLKLNVQEEKELLVEMRIEEMADSDTSDSSTSDRLAVSLPDVPALRQWQQRTAAGWLSDFTRFHSSSPALNGAMQRSLNDLRFLRSERDGECFEAAGLPWFATLFGRDSLLPAIQTAAFQPDIAASTLRLLARYQGAREDPTRYEQPGKMPHELRVGEMAHLHELRQTPDYISIDSTPLFLILLATHAAWTGSLALFEELRGNVERALHWLDTGADTDRDGFVDYDTCAGDVPLNQGWKDSGTAITNRDGSLAQVPIALAEVQGYVYRALTGIADLYRRAWDARQADQLDRQAQALRERFTRDFWMADEGCYCLALQKGGRQANVVASNAGQVLWSGIAEAEQAKRTADRLMQADMFTGWGIRTLSERAVRYNPINYHLGSVWPHDNALIAAGFKRYGLDEYVLRIADGLLDAAGHFGYFRLPEFFVGNVREEGLFPARCPYADPVQAWSAGAIPHLVTILLGLEPDAFNQRLRIVRPRLPPGVNFIQLDGLRIGRASVNLRFERVSDQRIRVEAEQVEGALEVIQQQASESP